MWVFTLAVCLLAPRPRGVIALNPPAGSRPCSKNEKGLCARFGLLSRSWSLGKALTSAAHIALITGPFFQCQVFVCVFTRRRKASDFKNSSKNMGRYALCAFHTRGRVRLRTTATRRSKSVPWSQKPQPDFFSATSQTCLTHRNTLRVSRVDAYFWHIFSYCMLADNLLILFFFVPDPPAIDENLKQKKLLLYKVLPHHSLIMLKSHWTRGKCLQHSFRFQIAKWQAPRQASLQNSHTML